MKNWVRKKTDGFEAFYSLIYCNHTLKTATKHSTEFYASDFALYHDCCKKMLQLLEKKNVLMITIETGLLLKTIRLKNFLMLLIKDRSI